VFGTDVAEIHPVDDHVDVRLTNGMALSVDALLFGVGREGNIRELGLEAAGVKVNEASQIAVDEHYQTSVSNIYAAGDVLGFPALASASMEQARVAVRHAFDAPPVPRLAFPLSVYTIPEIAMAGLSEEACQAQNQPHSLGFVKNKGVFSEKDILCKINNYRTNKKNQSRS
jgi:NAD(P) transhydrogenase